MTENKLVMAMSETNVNVSIPLLLRLKGIYLGNTLFLHSSERFVTFTHRVKCHHLWNNDSVMELFGKFEKKVDQNADRNHPWMQRKFIQPAYSY